jgi:hypothetical protein
MNVDRFCDVNAVILSRQAPRRNPKSRSKHLQNITI